MVIINNVIIINDHNIFHFNCGLLPQLVCYRKMQVIGA